MELGLWALVVLMLVGAATVAFVRGRHGLGVAAVVVAAALVGGLFLYG